MKQILSFLLIFLLSISNLSSQLIRNLWRANLNNLNLSGGATYSLIEGYVDDLTPFEKEFVRGALNYGEPDKRNHPYTMFNKNRTPDFHWTSDVITIRLVFTLAGDIPYKHKLKSV